ncbi:MAG: FGGY-family carbohydrate kinase [Leptospiraceae bacterium]|nr:FGGY-family carbohydrate kinase [Leptospiraceae bacterium]
MLWDMAGPEEIILAVDLGTSGCKTALCTLDGRTLSWSFRPVSLHLRDAHGAEQVPQDWWNALLESAAEALERAPVDSRQVAGICCSTQGEGTIPVDRHGNPLMNAILWMDMRGAPHVNRAVGGSLRVAGYGPLKLWKWIRLTGGAPALSGKDPFAHMLYVRDERPDVYERTYKFLNVLDYLNLKLTGRFVATHDSILTSWVTDNRNSERIRYDSSLLRASGIDPSLFPEIVPCTEVLGTVLPEVAHRLGISPQTPVVAGAIDNSAAAVGSGAVGDRESHLYIGTSSWLAAHMEEKKTDVISSIASVPCAIPGRYLMTAMQTTAGGNLAFLKERILYHEDELLRESHAPDVYKILDVIAERTPAGSRGLLYLPWLYGERSPVDDRSLRAGLINLSLEHSREDIIRAFLEGVALNTRWMMKPVQRFLRRQLESINIVGGGAISDIWCQIFADVLGIPVHQPESPVETNARGAAWIAGVGLKKMAFSDVSSRIRIRRTFEPEESRRHTMDVAFQRFLEAHNRLAPLYRKWNRETEKKDKK